MHLHDADGLSFIKSLFASTFSKDKSLPVRGKSEIVSRPFLNQSIHFKMKLIETHPDTYASSICSRINWGVSFLR